MKLSLLLRRPLWCIYPRSFCLVWVLMSLAIGVAGYFLGTKTEIPGPTNRRTLDSIPGERAALRANIPPRDPMFILLESATHERGSELFLRARDELIEVLKGTKSPIDGRGVFSLVVAADAGFAVDEKFISQNAKIALLQAQSSRPASEAEPHLKGLAAEVESYLERHPDFSVYYLSAATANNEMFAIIDSDLDHSLLYSLPLTFLILLWVFRSVVASLLPILVAGVSLIAGLGFAAVLSNWIGSISATSAQLVVLLVLAVGVDYALFIISRVREEVAGGSSHGEAILAARRSAGGSVLWSGLIVALSLGGLYLMGDTILASMATVAIAAVLLAMLSAVYFLPALLLILGNHLERGRLPLRGPRKDRPSPWWIRVSLRYPFLTFVVSLGLLGALGAAALHMDIGSTVEPNHFPRETETYKGYEKLVSDFPGIAGVDFSVILSGPNVASLEEEGDLAEFVESIRQKELVAGPLQIVASDDGSVIRYQFIARGSVNDPRNRNLVRYIRSDLVPRLEDEGLLKGVTVSLSGTLPYAEDATETYIARTGRVCIAVLLVSAALLLVAFRSVVVPLKAITLNLLSTAAAFGFLVVCFQYQIFGDSQVRVIESFVPALLFAILFGLSMDYHVFLLSRVREEMLRDTGDKNRESITRALEATFPTITGAAAIMIAVFAIIATLQLPLMRQLGIGLAVAIIIDATIVRCLLLPASLLLLGRFNWYLPKSLRWLPRLEIK